jgi:hypothetical protein
MKFLCFILSFRTFFAPSDQDLETLTPKIFLACRAACGAEQSGSKPGGVLHRALDLDPQTQMNPNLIGIRNSAYNDA